MGFLRSVKRLEFERRKEQERQIMELCLRCYSDKKSPMKLGFLKPELQKLPEI